MQDHEIVALYWARSPDAITHSQEKYGAYCTAIAQNILSCAEDAEECVADTWISAWNAMPPHRPEILRLFFAKITRRISFSRFRKATAQKRGGTAMDAALEELGECLVSETDVEGEVIADALGESIRLFLRTLPAREADVFLRRYFFVEPLSVIAKRFGLTENHTAVLLRRTRKRLREWLIKEGWFDEQK